VQLLTHSRLSCFRACPRKHFLRYELGLTPAERSLALRVGSAFHSALEAQDKSEDVTAILEAAVESPFDLALVAAMVNGHTARWANDALQPVASEQQFEMPLVNPETGAPTPIWKLAGIVDRIVQMPDGRLALMEYKTTSRDFAPGADYWVRLHMDQQLSIYVIAARALGYQIDTILYDVTRRPAQRPLKATPTEARKYTKDGKLYANQRDVDETPDEYAARVAADIAERPDHYFARIEIARLDQDLDECAWEIWRQPLAIR
jgi:RecB family exonuclease